MNDRQFVRFPSKAETLSDCGSSSCSDESRDATYNEENDKDKSIDIDEEDKLPAWMRYAPRTGWTNHSVSTSSSSSSSSSLSTDNASTAGNTRCTSNRFSPLSQLLSRTHKNDKIRPCRAKRLLSKTKIPSKESSDVRVRITGRNGGTCKTNRRYNVEEAAVLLGMSKLNSLKSDEKQMVL